MVSLVSNRKHFDTNLASTTSGGSLVSDVSITQLSVVVHH